MTVHHKFGGWKYSFSRYTASWNAQILPCKFCNVWKTILFCSPGSDIRRHWSTEVLIHYFSVHLICVCVTCILFLCQLMSCLPWSIINITISCRWTNWCCCFSADIRVPLIDAASILAVSNLRKYSYTSLFFTYLMPLLICSQLPISWVSSAIRLQYLRIDLTKFDWISCSHNLMISFCMSGEVSFPSLRLCFKCSSRSLSYFDFQSTK